MKRPSLIPILPIILIGIAATAVAVIDRSDSDTAFIYRQRNLTPVTATVLEQFVASAPDPRPGKGGHRGLSASCASHGVGEFRNPWVCTVRYPVGGSVQYRVVISPTGEVNGANDDGTLNVYGCCVGFQPSQ